MDNEDIPERLEPLNPQEYGTYAGDLIETINTMIKTFNDMSGDKSMQMGVYKKIKEKTGPRSMFYFCCMD